MGAAAPRVPRWGSWQAVAVADGWNDNWLEEFENAPTLGRAVLRAVDTVVTSRWDAAQLRAASYHGSRREKLSQLRVSFARELGTVGALAGGMAAVPGIGTGTSLATSAAELAWFTTRSADIILTVAAIDGFETDDVAERRLWVLAILGFGSAASESVGELAREAGMGFGKQVSTSMPRRVLHRVNASLARRLLTRYGTRRGAVALGTAIPFGFGAVVGGTANYALARTLVRQSEKFFASYRP